MKSIVILFSILVAFSFYSCSKSSTTADPVPGVEFKFTSLVAEDTVMTVNDVNNITATATGSGLTYQWKASYGTIIGSGASVKWTVCHADTFTITCDVQDDQGHKESKTVAVHVR